MSISKSSSKWWLWSVESYYDVTFALQGLRRPRFALSLEIFRQFLAPLPVFWLLAIALEWGLVGVWWGILLVNWLAAGLSLLYIRKTLREVVP